MRPLTMRPLLGIAVLGSALTANPAAAQDSSAQPATKAEESKPESNKLHGSRAINALVENGPEQAGALEEVTREAALRKHQKAGTAPESAPAKVAAPAPVRQAPATVQAAPAGPPQKNLSGEEFRLIRVGSTEKEVLAVLGPPSSQVVVPDDDGHLRETFQYWVKGSPLGTVRLDNGRVVKIETRQK